MAVRVACIATDTQLRLRVGLEPQLLALFKKHHYMTLQFLARARGIVGKIAGTWRYDSRVVNAKYPYCQFVFLSTPKRQR